MGAPHSPKLQHYWNLTIRLFGVISRTLIRRMLPLCRGAVVVFYCLSRLSKRKGNNFQSCSCVSTTVWLLHLNFNETLGERAKWEQLKNTSFFVEILETAADKTAPVLPITSHIRNRPKRRGGHSGQRWICKGEFISDVLKIPKHGLTSVGR